MQVQLQRYTQRLIDEQCAKAGKIAICSQNDRICSFGNHDFAELGQQIVQELDCASVIVAEPLHPFPFLLLFRAPPSLAALVPRDSESRSSLHDIPLVRHCQNPTDFLAAICTALRKRKGCIVENIGLISQGSLTVEQSYIAWSSVLHATVIKYFEDLLTTGPQLTGEMETVLQYKNSCLKPFNTNSFLFLSSLPGYAQTIISEMSLAGQATVQLGLVDSFFGNISCAADTTLYISETSARLDELQSQIDPVPFDGSSTAGITASSELPAHRAIVCATGCKAILHGHPRFSVVMSFFAVPDDENLCRIASIPVVDGEGGVGGLAESLVRAFSLTGVKAVIVRGHGVFAISDTGFGEALTELAHVEQRCRDSYFTQLQERYQFE